MPKDFLNAARGGDIGRRVITVAIFCAACLIFSLSAPSFLTAENGRAIVLSSSALLIASIGATFVILMGSIDFSVGAIATFCGMLVAGLAPQIGFSAVPAACFAGLLFGVLNGLIYVYLRIPSILVTLGTATTLSGAVLFISDGQSVPIVDPAILAIAQDAWIYLVPNAVLIAAIIYLAALAIGSRTVLGRMAFAIGGDEQTATLVGVKVKAIKIQTFAFSGLLAGMAGALLAARLGSGTATMGNSMTLDSITAAVVGGTAITGGVGTVAGTLIGVVFITTLTNGMNIMAVQPYLQTIIQGVVILLAVLLNTKRGRAEDVR
ncbi:ABC transporter permease [Mesorhizobium sp.]|uniref:ABC transporter permease n=1 Tax=Mesorhizobium sp. TaxID=1871066 RepID=UPI000FE7F67A|nr:ABC transporter permease [Mesorhizobium sp.]RWG06131.1 MAG: ABC transporter permease [Mesorhizobium sp.]TIN42196.1 MAG: ABC transporter permease [Mesorhizobium sp.]TIR94946.1 MAG: ABC transporter permease [Mesorhizobium sp.]TIS03357.1 MAG: ABC transporter permease [Mesorhizobium sp.]